MKTIYCITIVIDSNLSPKEIGDRSTEFANQIGQTGKMNIMSVTIS